MPTASELALVRWPPESYHLQFQRTAAILALQSRAPLQRVSMLTNKQVLLIIAAPSSSSSPVRLERDPLIAPRKWTKLETGNWSRDEILFRLRLAIPLARRISFAGAPQRLCGWPVVGRPQHGGQLTSGRPLHILHVGGEPQHEQQSRLIGFARMTLGQSRYTKARRHSNLQINTTTTSQQGAGRTNLAPPPESDWLRVGSSRGFHCATRKSVPFACFQV